MLRRRKTLRGDWWADEAVCLWLLLLLLLATAAAE